MTAALTIVNGQLCKPPQPVDSMGVTVAGNAITSTTRDQRRRMFDQLAEMGIEVVRLLHTAKSDGVAPSEYQPTYDECRAAFPILHECFDDLADRGMLTWPTLQHRQRLTRPEAAALGVEATLFGPRPSGIFPGEIHDAFFWYPSVRYYVLDWMSEQLEEFGSHAGLGLVTPVNEKLCISGGGYAMNERTTRGTSQYGQAWFAAMDKYREVFGKTEREMDRAEIAKFQSCLGCGFFREAYYWVKRHTDVPVGSSPIFGSRDMSALPEAACCDFVDVHVYPSSTPGLPDPFLPNDVRTIQTVANACRVVGKPLMCGEYAGLDEGKKVKLPSWLEASYAVANAGFEVSTYYAGWLGVPGDAKVGLYDAMEDEAWRFMFDTAQERFRHLDIPPPREPHQLTMAELFGAKVGSTYVPPEIPGTQKWARNCGGVILPEIGWRV